MSFADELAANEKPDTRPSMLDQMLAQLPDKDRKELLAALADPGVKPVAIHRTLTGEKYGFKCSRSTVTGWAAEARK